MRPSRIKADGKKRIGLSVNRLGGKNAECKARRLCRRMRGSNNARAPLALVVIKIIHHFPVSLARRSVTDRKIFLMHLRGIGKSAGKPSGGGGASGKNHHPANPSVKAVYRIDLSALSRRAKAGGKKCENIAVSSSICLRKKPCGLYGNDDIGITEKDLNIRQSSTLISKRDTPFSK